MMRIARVAGVAALVVSASVGAGFAGTAIWHARAGTSVSRAPIIWRKTHFVLGAVVYDLQAFDWAIGHPANLRVVFMPWRSTYFPGRAVVNDAKLGAQTVIELQPKHQSLRAIGLGRYDHWLRTVFAKDAAAVGQPITVSFASEMNGPWYHWGSSSSGDFIRAWRHIHDLLSGTKAGKLITWLWQPSAIHYGTPSPTRWWPGSKYVNVIGLDGYYTLPQDNFQAIFARTIRQMRRLTNRPIMVGETAIGANTGREIPDMKNLFAGIAHWHLIGLVWFNIGQHGNIYHEDWRLQNHPELLRTFRAELSRAVRQAAVG